MPFVNNIFRISSLTFGSLIWWLSTSDVIMKTHVWGKSVGTKPQQNKWKKRTMCIMFGNTVYCKTRKECQDISGINRSMPLLWRHSRHDSVSNHQPHDCLLNRLFRRRSKRTSKFRVAGLCVGNSPVTGEFPAQKASNAENVSIWWRHHASSQWDTLLQSNTPRLIPDVWIKIVGMSICFYVCRSHQCERVF